MLPVLAGATAILFAIVSVSVLEFRDDQIDDNAVTEQFTSGGDDSAAPAAGGTAESAPPGAASAPESAPAQDIAPMTVPPGEPPIARDQELKPNQERVQEKSASMTLSTDPDEVDDVADGVVDVVDRYEGIVVASDVSSSGDRGRASFDLRIPTANLQAALADLSDLASVASRDEGIRDITAPFVTAEDRFTDAKAEVDALLEELGEADSSAEIASLREQLRIARSELAAARSQLGALKQRADFSVLSLTVTGDGDADGWSLGDALDTAKNVVEDLLGAILIALAVIVPLGALAFAVWLAWTKLQRRRRESSLD